MAAISELKWHYLTGLVNEMKSPNTFLQSILYNNKVPIGLEDIQIDVITRGRKMAPFVAPGAAGVMVEGYTSTFQSVRAPNIRIKRPFTPSELLFGRTPGTVVFMQGGDNQMSAVEQHIARDMQILGDDVTNTEEYMVAMALQGVISYSVAGQDSFSITYPRPSGNNITLTTFWDNGSGAINSNALLLENFHTAKEVIHNEVGLPVTDCILGAEAAQMFRLHSTQNTNFRTALDTRNLQMGQVTLNQQFIDSGAIYLGRASDIDFWQYSRTADLNGVSTSMIRSKYAEFFNRNDPSRTMYYGGIPDIDTFAGRLFQAQRFSKSWTTPDPSAMFALLHSRPLPVPRRPGSTVSMKVISG